MSISQRQIFCPDCDRNTLHVKSNLLFESFHCQQCGRKSGNGCLPALAAAAVLLVSCCGVVRLFSGCTTIGTNGAGVPGPVADQRENNPGSVRDASMQDVVRLTPTSLAREARADRLAALRKYRGKFIELSATMYEAGVHYQDGPYATLSTDESNTVVAAWFDRSEQKAALAIQKGQKTYIRGKNLKLNVHDDAGVYISLDECIILVDPDVKRAADVAAAEAAEAARRAKIKQAADEAAADALMKPANADFSRGAYDEAIRQFKKIAADYPDTKAGKRSQELLDGMKK